MSFVVTQQESQAALARRLHRVGSYAAPDAADVTAAG
jgi:hypothetical protein